MKSTKRTQKEVIDIITNYRDIVAEHYYYILDNDTDDDIELWGDRLDDANALLDEARAEK